MIGGVSMGLALRRGTAQQHIIPVFVPLVSTVNPAGIALALGKTALVAAGWVSCYYRRSNGSATALTLVDATTLGTWQSGGWKEVDATNMPGWYEFGLPSAAVIGPTSTRFVILTFKRAVGQTTYGDLNIRVDLVRSISP